MISEDFSITRTGYFEFKKLNTKIKFLKKPSDTKKYYFYSPQTHAEIETHTSNLPNPLTAHKRGAPSQSYAIPVHHPSTSHTDSHNSPLHHYSRP